MCFSNKWIHKLFQSYLPIRLFCRKQSIFCAIGNESILNFTINTVLSFVYWMLFNSFWGICVRLHIISFLKIYEYILCSSNILLTGIFTSSCYTFIILVLDISSNLTQPIQIGTINLLQFFKEYTYYSNIKMISLVFS